ncbi:MAG: S-methyl-5'-thioadenosine phosphorylase, partial [Deltaproteobacteria bacterium]
KIIQQNVAMAKNIIRNAVSEIGGLRNCQCGSAMQYAVITDKSVIPEETKRKLEPIIGKYL